MDLTGALVGSSLPSDFLAFGDVTLFKAFDGFGESADLWRTDGTEEGTALVKDIFIGGNSRLGRPISLGTAVVFGANDGVSGLELWRSDGTASGTTLVKDIWPGSEWSGPEDLFPVGSVAFFHADDGLSGRELWRTDGTEAGTFMVKDINAGPGHSLGGPFSAVVDGVLYFAANDGVNGNELWRSDGTEAGTTMVADIVPGNNDFGPNALVVFGNRVFFSVLTEDFGDELWASDGTAAGTTLVKDIAPGPEFSDAAFKTVVNGTLYFRATDGTTGHELWKTDGTEAGTVMVKDVRPGLAASNPAGLTAWNGMLVFSANDGISGTEPWVSDGTETGTVLLADIIEGPGSSLPFGFAPAPDERVYFSADDGVHGRELWSTDGTTVGTGLARDINPGPIGSNAGDLVVIGAHRLYFLANDGQVGVEPWTVFFNRPPLAEAGADQTVEPGVGSVLDGSASSDPDADSLTYVWTDASGSVVGQTAVVTLPPLPPGMHVFTLTVSDASLEDTDEVQVEVVGPPELSVDDLSISEGTLQLRIAQFQVSLSRPMESDVTFRFITAAGSASAFLDYLPWTSNARIRAGQISATVPVLIVPDFSCEPNEAFRIRLSNPTGAVLGDAEGEATIVDDDCGK
jgi:ELWxxDGT repeat protein